MPKESPSPPGEGLRVRHMNLDQLLRSEINKAVTAVFNQQVDNLQLQPTNQEFEGSHTLVCFPLTKISRKGPEETAKLVGEYLVNNSGIVARFNVIKGFLNLVLSDKVWVNVLSDIYANKDFGQLPSNGEELMVEYSSPNTNKPLHLGHLRNNFLGWSVSEIYKANGYNVHKVQIINDRGIHICKSMAAWLNFGDGETPASSGIKGDHLVGKYYVEFDKAHKGQLNNILSKIDQGSFDLFNGDEIAKLKQYIEKRDALRQSFEVEKEKTNFSEIPDFGRPVQILIKSALNNDTKWGDIHKGFESNEYETLDVRAKDKKKKELSAFLKNLVTIEEKIEDEVSAIKEIASNKTPMMQFAQELLRKWEAKDPSTIELWKTMNGWVYAGFDETYKKMHVDFDKLYYESDTYLLGKEEVLKGVEKGVFFRKEDGSVWVDLTADGLDQKVLLRSDGTSVYMTQDIGTAILRFRDFPNISGQVYTVGNEQEYHFKVLFLILQKLGFDWAKRCYHLSYGMVDLPTGKMKSREGTVVDADDLIAETAEEAEKLTREKGKLEGVSAADARKLFDMVGLAALKFFLLKVDPKKRMLFDPNESVQIQGFTGPFVQYCYARTQAVLRKAAASSIEVKADAIKGVTELEPSEREIVQVLSSYEAKLKEAAKEYAPSVIANFAYDLAKTYNQFYQTIQILSEADQNKLQFRVAMTDAVGRTIKKAMGLLGIEVPERM